MWVLAAFLAAVFNGVTAVIVKYGIHKTESTVATAIRTCAVLCVAWGMVLISGSLSGIRTIAPQALGMIVLSGVTTAIAWLLYFKALSIGEVNRVVSVDRGVGVVSTVVLAILLFQETDHLLIKAVGTIVMVIGIRMMVEKGKSAEGRSNRWVIMAVMAPIFGAINSVALRIVGNYGVESNLATALRTCVVMVVVWTLVLLQGKLQAVRDVDRRELKFILLSGVTNGAYWIINYYALRYGIVSVVAPIDKISVLVATVLSYFVLKEKFSRRTITGVAIIAAATLVITIFT